MFLRLFNVLVFVYKESTGSRRWNVPLFVHPDFLQMLRLLHLHWWIYVPSPPSLEPRTHYHAGVEIFIDDETREASV